MFLATFLLFSLAYCTTGSPVRPCVPDQCKLPSCRCAGGDIPGGLSIKETPQIVAISFDDDLRVIDYETYYSKVRV